MMNMRVKQPENKLVRKSGVLIMSKAPNTIKEIHKIVENLQNKERKKENEDDFSEFLYLRECYSEHFDEKNVKMFGIKGPKDSVYEVF